MMLKVFLVAAVFCLAELSEGVQQSLHYTYHYRARVDSGIPEINSHHFAASDIKADVNVYVTDPNHIVFKLDDVEIADFHGDADCELELDQTLPVEYRVPTADEPGHYIGLHAFGLIDGTEFQFYEGEPLWLINFYKSVVALLFPAPVRDVTYQPHSNITSQQAYKIPEDQIFGSCDSTYTQFKLGGVAANEYRKWFDGHVSEDVQLDPAASTSKTGRKTTGRKTTGRKTTGRKTTGVKTPPSAAQVSVPLLDPAVWQVIKSVNLEDCSDTVEHQHTLTGVYCSLSKDQCKNTLSRNSHSVFYVRGGDSGMRVEKAIVKGAILTSPRGFESEMIRSRSFQKLVLESVTALDASKPALDFSTKSYRGMLYTMILPYGGMSTNPREKWAVLGTLRESLEELTGYPVTADRQAQNQKRVVDLLKAAYGIVSHVGSHQETLNTQIILNYATYLLYDFNQAELDAVVESARADLPREFLPLLSGVLAEVGSVPSITALVKLMEEGEVAPLTQALLFGSLNINLKSAKPLRILLDYLKTQDIDLVPFKVSQSYVNFADLVYHFCVQNSPYSGSFGEFASSQCYDDHILPEFESLIIEQLESTEIFWKQMVLVKSLSNLRSPNSFEALLPYVLGQKACDTTVRLVALESLASWKAPRDYSDKITLILLELFENPAEDATVRSRALGFLVSWPLSSTIWSRLAFSTHRPLLQDLAGFTYSLIESVSKFKHPEALRDSLYATHALRLAKPISAGQRHSSYKTWYKYCFKSKISTLDHFETIIDPLSPLPSALAIYMRRVLGGTVIYSKMDFMIANDWGDLEYIAHELFRGEPIPYQHGKSGNWDRFLTMLTSGLDLKQRTRGAITGLSEIIPSNDIDFFIPFEYEFLRDTVEALSAFPHSFYYNSFEGTLVTVNDIGLPVVISLARPIVGSHEGDLSVFNSANEEYTLSTRYFSLSYSMTSRIHVKTMALWSGSEVASGFSKSLSLQLPYDVEAILRRPHHLRRHSGLKITFAQSKRAAETGFTVVSFESSPYTTLHSTAAADLEYIQQNVKVVYSLVDPFRMEKVFKNTLACGFKVQFQSDSAEPLMKEPEIMDGFLLDTLPATAATKFSVRVLDTAAVQGSQFTLIFNQTSLDRNPLSKFVSDYGQDSFKDSELCGATEEFQDMQQTGQTSDFYDYTQQSSNDAEFQTFQSQDFGSFGEFGGQQSVQTPQRLVEELATDAELARASYGAPDATRPILEYYLPYLRREKGWQEIIYGISVRAEIQCGSYTDAKELAMISTKCPKIQDKQNWKGMFIFGAYEEPTSTMCAEFDIVEPKFNDLDTLDTLIRKDFTQVHTLKTYSGTKCRDGPFIEATDTRSLSPNMLKQIVSEIQNCTEPSSDPIDDFARLAYYDTLIEHENTFHQVNRTGDAYRYEKFVRILHDYVMKKFFIPNTNLELCDVWNNEIAYSNAKADRLAEDGRYVGLIVTKSKSENSGRTKSFSIKYPPFFDNMVNKIVSVGYSYTPADYCVIDETSLVTFDGLHTSFSVDGCPALAVSSCEAGSHDKFAVGVMASRTGGLAVNIVARYRQLIINVDSDGVNVNGEKQPDNAYIEIPCEDCYPNTVSGHIYYRNGFRKLEVDDTLSVILKGGKVYIKVAPRYNGYICGLCGNHDGVSVNDMKQPNGCLLTDAQKFRQSWIPQSSFSCFSDPGESADQCLKEEHVEQDTYSEHHIVY